MVGGVLLLLVVVVACAAGGGMFTMRTGAGCATAAVVEADAVDAEGGGSTRSPCFMAAGLADRPISLTVALLLVPAPRSCGARLSADQSCWPMWMLAGGELLVLVVPARATDEGSMFAWCVYLSSVRREEEGCYDGGFQRPVFGLEGF